MGVGKYWTDGLNPIKVGKRSYHCTKISPGCQNCWAELMNITNLGGVRYDDRDVNFWLDEAVLDKPFHWTRKARTIFVCHLCDLFHDLVPFEFVDEILAVAALTRHKYLFLTKRPVNQRSYFLEHRSRKVADIIFSKYGDKEDAEEIAVPIADGFNWPPENCIFGVSIEDQKRADERIPELMKLKTELFPDIKLWFSVEPILGLIGLSEYFKIAEPDWVICGGESGEHSRPPNRGWLRMIRDDCVECGVPFYFKQWGGINPESAGRKLDGRTWDELPKMLQKESDK